MTITAPADPSALLTAPSSPEVTDPPVPNAPPSRGGLAGLVAEVGRQHRANGQARRQRREDARDRRAARRATRQGPDAEHPSGLGAWLRALPGTVQEGGVQLGYGMALIGSGVGQLSWWSSQFPLMIAASFALSFEAIMIGSSRRARRLRREGHAAGGLRIIAWSAAIFGAGLNWVHLRDPQTTLALGNQLVHGSPSLGAAFAAFTALGFATHEVATSSDVRTELVRKGYLRPLGARRWLPPFTFRAWRARLLLIEDPTATVDQAWSLAARPRDQKRGWRLRKPRSAHHEPAAEPIADDAVPEHSQQPPAPANEPTSTEVGQDAAGPTGDPVTDPATAAPQRAATAPTATGRSPRTETTDEILGDEMWLAMLQPVAQELLDNGDWLSVNDVMRASGAMTSEGMKGVGKGRASRLLERLTQEAPVPPPSPARDTGHRERILKIARKSTDTLMVV